MSITLKKEFGNTRQRKPDLSALVYGRVPPQSPEMEEAILGACMLERDTFDELLTIIKSEEVFYVDAHQKIFAAMLRLISKGAMIDLLTITEELRKTNELELIGGAAFLSRLTMSVITSAHVSDHAHIVLEKFMQRELIRVCGAIIGDAYEDSTDVFDLIDKADQGLLEIKENIPLGNAATLVGETYSEILLDIEAKKSQPDLLPGIDTGYEEINNITNGWQPGELIILAARPAQGKTAFALNLALNAATSKINPCDCLIFSLEASKKELVKRMAACKNDVYYSAIRKGVLNEYQEKLMMEGYKDFQNMRIRIDDKTHALDKICHNIRMRKKRTPSLGLVIIDYLQLIMTIRERNGNREQDISNISRTLKLLAKELEISIIPLSQLNRQAEARMNKKPQLADLRESGAIEQDANIVMMLWHEAVANGEGINGKKTWVLFEKCRDAPANSAIHIPFAGDIQRWGNLSPIYAINEPFRPFAGMPTNLNNIQ